jgi:hypothetical protein
MLYQLSYTPKGLHVAGQILRNPDRRKGMRPGRLRPRAGVAAGAPGTRGGPAP